MAEHPWSNGEIVTYGGSYSGFVQWAAAATHPEPLRAIAPVAGVYPGRDFPMANNIPLAYAARWLETKAPSKTNPSDSKRQKPKPAQNPYSAKPTPSKTPST